MKDAFYLYEDTEILFGKIDRFGKTARRFWYLTPENYSSKKGDLLQLIKTKVSLDLTRLTAEQCRA